VKDDRIYVLEVNPRASGRFLVTRQRGFSGPRWRRNDGRQNLKELGIERNRADHSAVKESVFPFNKFAGVDTLLGPEMKSTGEVMGIDSSFGAAFLKSSFPP